MEIISKPHRFYEIDLLRFLAALSVMLYHYGFRGYSADNMTSMPYLWIAPIVKYGNLGVNLFFIISGFVILMTASGGSARRFVVSRVVRLYPAFWACCTLTFLAIVIAGGTRYHASLWQYILNMTMFGGFIDVKPIDGAYWSLFVEMKFYALVLAVLLFRQMHRIKELLGLWLILVLLISHWPIPYAGSFLIPKYAPYFIAGAMFYIVHTEGICAYKIFIIVMSYLLALREALHKLSSLQAYFHTYFSSIATATTLAIFFIVFFFISTGRTRKLAGDKWLFLGALTYPLYLLHENIGFIIFNKLYPHVNQHVIMIGTIGAMLIAAFIVNRMVEKRYAKPMKVLLEKVFRIQPRPSTTA